MMFRQRASERRQFLFGLVPFGSVWSVRFGSVSPGLSGSVWLSLIRLGSARLG